MIKEKKKEKYVVTSVALPESLWTSAKIYAVKKRTTLSEMVRNILTEYISKVEDEGGEQKDE